MYFSLENRSPFLSKNLFEYVYKLKKDFFMYKGILKAMLRKAMRENFQKIFYLIMKKQDFILPLDPFLKKDFIKIRKYLLNSKILRKNLNIRSFHKLLKKPNILHQESKFIFACLNIAILEKVINN